MVTELRLAKLPDRAPVKLTITMSAQLGAALQDYAKAYEKTYGAGESVANLVPYMLEAFLEADRGFARMRTKG